MESDRASQSPGWGGGPQRGEPGQGRGRLQGPEEAPVEAQGLVCEVEIIGLPLGTVRGNGGNMCACVCRGVYV